MKAKRWRNISWRYQSHREKRKYLVWFSVWLFTYLLALAGFFVWGDIVLGAVSYILVRVSLYLLGFLLIFLFVLFSWENRARTNSTEVVGGLIGETGVVRSNNMVLVKGALWKADCDQPLSENDSVEIIDVHGLTLKVRKV